jgi:hypothetical protein
VLNNCRTGMSRRTAGPAEEKLRRIPVSNMKTAIPLALPSLEAKALAQFVKRLDFETVASMSTVTVVSDGKSEADLIWFALNALRGALAQVDAKPR